jgi:hypothetical protein
LVLLQEVEGPVVLMLLREIARNSIEFYVVVRQYGYLGEFIWACFDPSAEPFFALS